MLIEIITFTKFKQTKKLHNMKNQRQPVISLLNNKDIFFK
jgi:hypothetical protein